MKKFNVSWEEVENNQYPPECNAKEVWLCIHPNIDVTLSNDPDYHNGRSDLFYVKKTSDLMFLFDNKSRKIENAKKYVLERLKFLIKNLSKYNLDV